MTGSDGPLSLRPVRLRAFSLIELLVVIAIVALLASMVMASVAATRKAAKRTVCSGNLRQTAMAMSQFATERQGMVPLVYETCKQATYPIWNTSALPRGWGLLFDYDYLDTPRALYCPSVSPDLPYLLYNGTGNVWKASGTYTRASYGVRPEQLVATNATAATVLASMPLLKNYHTRALAADACSQSGQIAGMHASGLNAAYGDGHVRWVDRALLAPSWRAIPANASWSNGYDAAGTALWNSLDAAR